MIKDELKYAEITGKYFEDDDEAEDLDSGFGVNTQQAVSACTRLAMQNMSEPREIQAASEEQILAMQHIQDQVQANTAKRMNDIWRIHV